MPHRTVLPNGIPLNVLNAGESDVVRFDLLIEGGRWQQTQLLQALFVNRMLREGTRRFTSTEIAEKLAIMEPGWTSLAHQSMLISHSTP